MHSSLINSFSKHVDIHQSPFHAKVMQKIDWKVDGKPGSQIFYRTLGPLTIAKYQRPRLIDIERLAYFRRSHKTLTTYVEPGLDVVYETGFPVEPFAHSTTSLIDLTQSNQDLLASFSQKTRYNLTHTIRTNKIKIVSTPLTKLSKEKLQDFFTLLSEWSKRKNVIGYSQNLLNAILTSFDRDSTLHLAYDQHRQPVAALLILSHDRVSTYYAAFSSELGYHLYAPTLLTYQAFNTARDNGSEIFDFGGTYDPRYPRMYKKWSGFTKFKEGFRPTTIQYPPTKLHLFW